MVCLRFFIDKLWSVHRPSCDGNNSNTCVLLKLDLETTHQKIYIFVYLTILEINIHLCNSFYIIYLLSSFDFMQSAHFYVYKIVLKSILDSFICTCIKMLSITYRWIFVWEIPYKTSYANLRFCLLPKATAGGGGRGMRLAKERDEFVKLLQVLRYEPNLLFA